MAFHLIYFNFIELIFIINFVSFNEYPFFLLIFLKLIFLRYLKICFRCITTIIFKNISWLVLSYLWIFLFIILYKALILF